MMTDDYRANHEKGLQYQDFAFDQLFEQLGISTVPYSSRKYQLEIGESRGGIEIKFDDRIKETGNIYIEVAEKSNANNDNYCPSGIYRHDNAWLYAIGDYSVIYVFPINILRAVYECGSYAKAGGRKVETPTSIGYVIPVVYAEKKLAAKVIYCNTS